MEGTGRTIAPGPTSNFPAEEPAGGSPDPAGSDKITLFDRLGRWAKSPSSWQVLGQRDFRRYFFGSLISNLGTWLQSTAQVLIAYQITRSVFTVGLIASAQFAGMIVVSPWAPVLADRFSPRVVLGGTQCFSALIAILMAGLHFAGMLGVGWLLAGALGLGLAFSLALPVQTALVPGLVRDEDAADAVKMNSVSYNVGRAVAPAVCVPVIIFIGPDLIFALNAISFIIFVMILRHLPRIADERPLRRASTDMLNRLWGAIAPRCSPSRTAAPARGALDIPPRARVRDGMIAALQRRRLLLLMAIVMAVTLADDPILVLSPSVAAKLHAPSASAGYFIAALGWGSVLGSLPPSSAGNKSAQHASRRAAFSLLVLGVSIVVFTMGFSFGVSLGAVVTAGAAGLFAGTAAQTALLRHHQKNGPDVAAVASVAALWAIAWAGSKPFASLLDGLLATHIGIISTSIALTAPAIAVALCELVLPPRVKCCINDGAKEIISRVFPDALSPRPGAESPPRPDGSTPGDALPAASRLDEGVRIAPVSA
jgi:MFS family permease